VSQVLLSGILVVTQQGKNNNKDLSVTWAKLVLVKGQLQSSGSCPKNGNASLIVLCRPLCTLASAGYLSQVKTVTNKLWLADFFFTRFSVCCSVALLITPGELVLTTRHLNRLLKSSDEQDDYLHSHRLETVSSCNNSYALWPQVNLQLAAVISVLPNLLTAYICSTFERRGCMY